MKVVTVLKGLFVKITFSEIPKAKPKQNALLKLGYHVKVILLQIYEQNISDEKVRKKG